ncbi:hypothetical protein P8452_71357 [Trifolium repens]|nr:hypothetical protein P8452_71357 [Trifolium repens]
MGNKEYNKPPNPDLGYEDADVLDMFKLYSMCSCIHVYATILNHEETEVPRQLVDTIVSDSDVEWVGDELEQNESEGNLLIQ